MEKLEKISINLLLISLIVLTFVGFCFIAIRLGDSWRRQNAFNIELDNGAILEFK